MQSLKLNLQHEDVQIVQLLLDYSKDDGLFDKDFETFVKEWQGKNNLTADGIIGPASYKVIAANAPTVSTVKNKKSKAAKALQLAIDVSPADGIFGPKSKAALVNYQSAGNLKADGICGAKTWAFIFEVSIASTPSSVSNIVTKGVKPVDYKQNDSKWGSKKYTSTGQNQTIASSGCGPTSGADIVATWWDSSITPVETCKMALDWGCRTANSGTTGSFFKKLANKYGASKYSTTSSLETVINCLDAGGYVVVCFGPGTKGKSSYQKWTKGGHYCVIWQWDGKYFYINDPASTAEARKKGTYDEVKDARKGFYMFWK